MSFIKIFAKNLCIVFGTIGGLSAVIFGTNWVYDLCYPTMGALLALVIILGSWLLILVAIMSVVEDW